MYQFQVARQLSPTDLAELGALRERSWRATGYDFYRPFDDDHILLHDAVDSRLTTEHVLVRDGGQLVGAGRVSYHTDLADMSDAHYFASCAGHHVLFALFGRLVVDPEYWGRGLSRRIDQIRLHTAIARGADEALACAVGVHRCRSLLAQGFDIISEFTQDCDIKGKRGLKFFGMHQQLPSLPLTAHEPKLATSCI